MRTVGGFLTQQEQIFKPLQVAIWLRARDMPQSFKKLQVVYCLPITNRKTPTLYWYQKHSFQVGVRTSFCAPLTGQIYLCSLNPDVDTFVRFGVRLSIVWSQAGNQSLTDLIKAVANLFKNWWRASYLPRIPYFFSTLPRVVGRKCDSSFDQRLLLTIVDDFGRFRKNHLSLWK